MVTSDSECKILRSPKLKFSFSFSCTGHKLDPQGNESKTGFSGFSVNVRNISVVVRKYAIYFHK